MKIGEVPLGASVGVSLEVRGAACDGALQRRTWTGEPLDFNFSAEADADVKQAVFLARVFVDDAQIGVLAFTRPVGGATRKRTLTGDRVRLKRHKRVFLSYSSKDRETVSAIATAYRSRRRRALLRPHLAQVRRRMEPAAAQRDRPRRPLPSLLVEIGGGIGMGGEGSRARADAPAPTRKKPDITVQMLDGPPWAHASRHLDSINFDDFVRAAIVGYARGDGSKLKRSERKLRRFVACFVGAMRGRVAMRANTLRRRRRGDCHAARPAPRARRRSRAWRRSMSLARTDPSPMTSLRAL